MALRLMIREAAAETEPAKATGTTPPAAAGSAPAQLPERFETIPTDVQQKQFIRPIINRIKALNPNVAWTDGIEDEAINYYRLLKDEYNKKQGKIGDINSFIEKLITKPIEKAAPAADKEKPAKTGKKKAGEKAAEQPAEKPAKQKFVSPLRSHLQKEFPEVRFTAAQVNFINKLLKPYGFFTLTEAFNKSKIVNKIINAILTSELFKDIRDDYGKTEFKNKLNSMFSALGGLTPAEQKETEKSATASEPASPKAVQTAATPEQPQAIQPEKNIASTLKTISSNLSDEIAQNIETILNGLAPSGEQQTVTEGIKDQEAANNIINMINSQEKISIDEKINIYNFIIKMFAIKYKGVGSLEFPKRLQRQINILNKDKDNINKDKPPVTPAEPAPTTATKKPEASSGEGEEWFKQARRELPLQKEYNEYSERNKNKLFAIVEEFASKNNVSEDVKESFLKRVLSLLMDRGSNKSIPDDDYKLLRIVNSDGRTYNKELANKIKQEIQSLKSFSEFMDEKAKQESLYEGLFNKFTINKQTNNSKQLFTFDGNRFKKYNRG